MKMNNSTPLSPVEVCTLMAHETVALLDAADNEALNSAAEKKVLTAKMEAFCQEVTGLSLKDYCAQIQAEDMAPPSGQTMG